MSREQDHHPDEFAINGEGTSFFVHSTVAGFSIKTDYKYRILSLQDLKICRQEKAVTPLKETEFIRNISQIYRLQAEGR